MSDKQYKFHPATGHGRRRPYRVVMEPGINCAHDELRGKRGRLITYRTWEAASAAADRLTNLFRSAWMV